MSNDRERQIQNQFTSRVPIYDRRSAWILDTSITGAMVEACKAPRDAQLLDVCCGTGAVGGAFAGRVGRRVGVDLTQAMLDTAKGRLDEVVQGDARALPFPDATFDVVVSRQALHFFHEPDVPIREMARVLKPGGQIVLGQRVPYGKADEAWMSELNFLKQPNLATFMLEEHLTGGLARAGISDVTTRDVQVWESIDDWVASPEVSAENAKKILAHVQNAPESVRKVHPIEQRPDGSTWACWRWVIVTGFKR